MTENDGDNRPTFGLANGSAFRKAAELLPTDPARAVRLWRQTATRGPLRSEMVRRRLMLEAGALSRLLAESGEEASMSASDDRRTTKQELADACRALAAPGEPAPSAIGTNQDRRTLTQREVEWLQEFNRKMVDLGQPGMEQFLRDTSRRLRMHETRASLAFRPLRLSNELPVMLQLAEVWREGLERRQSWSSMLFRIVLHQIGRKVPPKTSDDWSFLRDAWRLAGVMNLARSPAAAARNQIDAFRRRVVSNDVEFTGLLAVMDSAVAADTDRSMPTDLSAILLFRRRLAREPSAPDKSVARLLAAWTASNRNSIELEKQRPNDEYRLSDIELERKISEDWASLSNDPEVRPSLEALTADPDEVGTCWTETAELVFGRPMAADEAKNQLLEMIPAKEAERPDGSYDSSEGLRELAMAG